MSDKPSRYSEETRAKESWLPSVLGREPGGQDELEPLLRTAALTRACLETVPVPDGAEQHAYATAIGEWERSRAGSARPGADLPSNGLRWIGRMGHWMRFVFTLGRRR